jgi:hypothetical protein
MREFHAHFACRFCRYDFTHGVCFRELCRPNRQSQWAKKGLPESAAAPPATTRAAKKTTARAAKKELILATGGD